MFDGAFTGKSVAGAFVSRVAPESAARASSPNTSPIIARVRHNSFTAALYTESGPVLLLEGAARRARYCKYIFRFHFHDGCAPLRRAAGKFLPAGAILVDESQSSTC